jgi:hypothetical protein
MDKEQLIERMQASRAEVMAVIDAMSGEGITDSPNADGWTVKDILAHLARWEGELVTLLWQLSQGGKLDCVLVQDPMPVDSMNQAWHEADRNRPLERVRDDLRGVRQQTIRRLESFSSRDLEREDLHPSLRGIALWHRVAANTFEHDEEHLADLRARRAE